MSPEQVRGKSIDARTDIFALGATFYEMLTGRRAFARDTPVETLGAVLHDDPEEHAEAQKIPVPLQPFVFRALEKDAADRYQSARDLLLDLRAYQAERTPGPPSASSSAPSLPGSTAARASSCAGRGSVLLVLGFWAGSCWQRDARRLCRGALRGRGAGRADLRRSDFGFQVPADDRQAAPAGPGLRDRRRQQAPARVVERAPLHRLVAGVGDEPPHLVLRHPVARPAA